VGTGLAFGVLGPVEVRVHGQIVDVPAGRQRALLAALLLGDCRVVPLDRLVDALWPDGAVPSARNAVQTYVARLRRTLGPDVLATRPPGYLLETSAADRDDRDFLRAVAAAERLAESAPAPALARLEHALAAWRGPAWAEFADSFARPAAVRLEERRDTAQELRVRLLLRTGAPEHAVATAEALVVERPVAEPPTLLLAEALGAAGRTADALAALSGYRERLRDELGLDPGPPVAAVRARLLRGEVPRSQPAVRPAPARPGRYRADPLIGREDLLASLSGAVARARLVTLVGPGGVGKTRLAQQLASGAAGACWWVDLAPLRESAHVARAVADAAGVAVHPGGTPLEALTRWAATVDGLLVLDNCEHLLATAAAVAEALLECGGGLRAVATSRERLGVDGESVLPVAPLPVPVAGAPDPAAVAAVRLFLDRARRADPGFDPDARELAVIGEVCRRLDGLPLALEFAAARVRGLAVDDLAARLDARLDLLTSGRRHDDARHRTLRGVIDWSYALLSPAEQAALRALGTFAGAFDLTAAEAVLDDGEAPAADLVSRLVDRSVLHRVAARGTAPARYRLLESVRAYVHECTGPADAGAADRHTRWVLDLLSTAERGLAGRDEASWAAALVAVMDDVRAAVVRAREAGRPEEVAAVCARLWRFASWRLRVDILQWADGLLPDRSSPDRALAEVAAASARWVAGDVAGARDRAAGLAGDGGADPLARAAAHEVLGDALLGTGEVDRAVAAYARSTVTWQATGRTADRLIAAANEAMAHGFAGATEDARRILAEVLRECVAGGNPTTLAFARYVEGEVYADLDPDRALAALAEAQRLAAGVGNDLVTGVALTAEVAVRGRHGPPNVALARYADALRHWHRAGTEGLLVTALRNLVVLFARTGRDRAAAELSATLATHATDHPSYGPERRRLRTAQRAVAARLDPREAARAERAGQARTIREASAAALAIVTGG
jgi:predicted ATPase/DNA-binding SARP family transcriptional activator